VHTDHVPGGSADSVKISGVDTTAKLRVRQNSLREGQRPVLEGAGCVPYSLTAAFDTTANDMVQCLGATMLALRGIVDQYHFLFLAATHKNMGVTIVSGYFLLMR
jgi:hypothetical protein